MANPNGRQGAGLEKVWRERLSVVDEDVQSLKQGGVKDRGDISFRDPWGNLWIMECKAAAALSVTKELADAKAAAEHDRRSVAGVVLAWKRLVGKKDEGRRKPLGEREVVCMDPDTFMLLLELAGATRDSDRRKW